MSLRTIACAPFDDQMPGTSGLRKRTVHFQQPHYLETFIQAIFATRPPRGALVVGGDGRYFNAEAIQTIIRMAIAQGCRHLIVGRNGILSTPAVSHLVRSRQATGAIILSASHNPAGPDGDFGVKYNGENGAPASEDVTRAIYETSVTLEAYQIYELACDVDLSEPGDQVVAGARIEIVDSSKAYADLMETLFDFDQIRRFIAENPQRMRFDAMNAVTGPYAREIFVERLGAAEDTLVRCIPLTDFGHAHPDPTPSNATQLIKLIDDDARCDFGAASDGDGDRHMILGRGFQVNPSDSLAILLANAEHVPGYRGRLKGVARSMPTSRAADAVAKRLGLPCYETPTGWKFFGSLLDAGAITICGEESAGAGSDHIREKDGLWAVLFWLNILAARRMSVRELVQAHWREFGRHVCMRVDFEGLQTEQAKDMMTALQAKLGGAVGVSFGDMRIEAADVFDYIDPISGATTAGQGLRVALSGDRRIVYRLSGTGTSGATLRIYLEHLLNDPAACEASAADLLAPMERAAVQFAEIERFTGVSAPTARV